MEARGFGINQRLSLTRDNWINRSQQFHIFSNIAFFEKLFEKQSAKQIKKIQTGALWVSIVDNHLYRKVSGLASWLSRWVREATGSLPDCPQRGIIETICPNKFIISGILHFLEKLNEKQYAPQMIKKLINWGTMIINCWQPSSWDGALEVWFSLWKREVSGSTSGYLQHRIIELIGHNNSISSVILHFLRNYLKNSPQNRFKKIQIGALWVSIVENHLYRKVSGLASWLSRWVREATGSLPDCPQRGIIETICANKFIISGILHFLEKLNEKQYAPQMIKKLINWSTMIINCWQPSSKDSDPEVKFSLWKREV